MTRLRHLLFGVAVTVVGCSRGEPAAAVAEPGPLVAVLPAPDEPKPPAPAVTPPPAPVTPPPTPYRAPTDLGGKAVAALTAPKPPAPLALPSVVKPVPRVSDFDRGELPAAVLKPTTRVTPLTPSKPARPTPPSEGLPADFGLASVVSTAGVKLAETVIARPPAPPAPLGAGDLPPQAQQRLDRPPADDVTDDLLAARVVFTPLARPAVRELLMLFRLPDPFALAEQLRRQPTPPVAPADADAKPVQVK